MEKKLVALVTITLLIGLLAGYALNYVIYQPQLQDLHNNLDELNAKVDDYNSTIDNLLTEISRLNSIVDELNSSITTEPTPEDNETEVPLPFERLQFQSLTAIKDGSNFELNFNLTNTGTTTAVLEMLFFNQTMHFDIVELSSLVINSIDLSTTTPFDPVIISPGNTASGTITIAESAIYETGTSFILSFRTITQRVYSETVVLP